MDREITTQLRSKDSRSLPTDQRVAGVVGRLRGRRTPATHRRTRLNRVCPMMDERWDSLLECTPDLVVVVDREGLILHVNHMLGKLAGSQEGIVGRSICDFLAPDYRMRVRESIECVFQTGETLGQVVCFSANGRGGLCSEARIGPIAQNGRTVAVGMFFADVTEREKLQTRLREKEMLLRSIVRAVPKMMEIMEGLIHQATDVGESRRSARELELCRRQMTQMGRLAAVGEVSSSLTQRLPQFLTAIGMSIENALAQLDPTSCRDGAGRELEVALQSVSALAAGVEQVRDFAETASRKPLVHAVDLRAILVRIVLLLETRARETNTVIRVDNRDEWPQVRMAEGDAEQLLFSLLDNLLRVADGKRNHRITICGAVRDHHVELRFSTDGDLSEEETFDMSLGHPLSGEPVAKAIELGPYVAAEIVIQSGGTMRCENIAGVGGAFFVRLPIAERTGSQWDKSGKERETTDFCR